MLLRGEVRLGPALSCPILRAFVDIDLGVAGVGVDGRTIYFTLEQAQGQRAQRRAQGGRCGLFPLCNTL